MSVQSVQAISRFITWVVPFGPLSCSIALVPLPDSSLRLPTTGGKRSATESLAASQQVPSVLPLFIDLMKHSRSAVERWWMYCLRLLLPPGVHITVHTVPLHPAPFTPAISRSAKPSSISREKQRGHHRSTNLALLARDGRLEAPSVEHPRSIAIPSGCVVSCSTSFPLIGISIMMGLVQ